MAPGERACTGSGDSVEVSSPGEGEGEGGRLSGCSQPDVPARLSAAED